MLLKFHPMKTRAKWRRLLKIFWGGKAKLYFWITFVAMIFFNTFTSPTKFWSESVVISQFLRYYQDLTGMIIVLKSNKAFNRSETFMKIIAPFVTSSTRTVPVASL